MVNKVFLMNCMDFMKDCKDNEFDLSIVDPPYGIGLLKTKAGNWGIGKTKKDRVMSWDNNRPENKYFTELFRISVNQIIWGANNFTDLGIPGSSAWVCWDKNNGKSYWSDFELAYTSFNNIEGKTGARFVKFRVVENKEKRIHPTQKPVTLYKWLLKNYAKPGQTIFDSHIGSGSIRIACHDLGFDLVGCELDPDYYEAQEKRFQEHIKQNELFGKDEIQGLIYEK